MTRPPKDIDPYYGAAIFFLREWKLGWPMRKLAEESGVSVSSIFNYESGKTTPSPEMRARLARALGIAPEGLERLAAILRKGMGEAGLQGSTGAERLAEEVSTALADDFQRGVFPLMARFVAVQTAEPPPASDEEILALAPILRRHGAKGLKTLVEQAPSLRRWAFVKLAGEESARAASVDTKRALDLADFAFWLAERVPGDEGWASRVFAWEFLGNARRVSGDLKSAEEAFAQAARLRAEPPANRPELPESWRLLDLEASFQTSLRRIPEALRLLDQAAQAAPSTGPVQARLLCLRSNALERLGDAEGSIAALREALEQINSTAEPRLFYMLLFNLMDSLCSIGRAAEATELLPELRRLQAHMGNGLNQIRLRWLDGKIAAGLGRTGEAIEALSWVRAAFAHEDSRYDEAQAGMELAGLYLEQGRTAEVKRLVLQMEPVFRAKGVHSEARKALALFRRAVDMETVTREMICQVVAYLRRAQGDPGLRFEEAARRG